MDTRAHQLKTNAVDCLRAAQRATDMAAKSALLQLAQIWRMLAEQAEQLNREHGRHDKDPADD